MSDQKLKPCPFCGGEAMPPNELDHHVSCSNCGATGANWAEYGSAVEAWNARYQEDSDFQRFSAAISKLGNSFIEPYAGTIEKMQKKLGKQ